MTIFKLFNNNFTFLTIFSNINPLAMLQLPLLFKSNASDLSQSSSQSFLQSSCYDLLWWELLAFIKSCKLDTCKTRLFFCQYWWWFLYPYPIDSNKILLLVIGKIKCLGHFHQGIIFKGSTCSQLAKVLWQREYLVNLPTPFLSFYSWLLNWFKSS